MSGALVDLVAIGIQDTFITGNPQISFFRSNYKRYVNFSIEPAQLDVIGQGAAGGEVKIVIPNKGDLLGSVWIDAEVDDTSSSNINVGQVNPTEFSLYIGGKLIDRQDGFFTNTVWPLCLASTPTKALQPINSTPNFFPLHFFNCDNNETPIPLVALQYQTVEIQVKYSSSSEPGNLKYYAEFIQLDTDERKWFTSKDHDLLITQVQKVTADANGSDLCYLNHPVKGLMWGTRPTSTFDTTKAEIFLNGSSLFDTSLPSKFFTNVQRYYHCDNTIDHATGSEIFMYSFAERLNNSQPSGTCNFSRLDNAKINWTTSGAPDTPTSVYAVNYNVLSIKNGLSGIKFSN